MDDGRFLILSLSEGRFAIPIAKLLEITIPRGMAKDSGLSSAFEGKVEFRGMTVPVLNLKKTFQLPGKPGNVLLVTKGSRATIGILVDEVTEIVDSEQKPADLPAGVVSSDILVYAGVLRHKGELILLLNEDRLPS